MAINYAAKFSAKVDERFRLSARTAALKGGEGYEFSGVNTVTVYTIPIVAMNDYALTGTTRFGTASELQNTKQDLLLSKDRAFTFTIDKASEQDTMGVMAASKALKRQIEDVIIPEVDAYRLATLRTGATTTSAPVVITAANAYSSLLEGQGALDDLKIPEGNRMAYCKPSYYNFLKKDNNFIRSSNMGQKKLDKGILGEVDGIMIYKAPTNYFPAGTEFIICHKTSLVTVQKLEDYRISTDQVGISGSVVEGRIRYDAFVLTNKADSIYVHKNV